MRDATSVTGQTNHLRNIRYAVWSTLFVVCAGLSPINGQAAVKITSCTVTKPSNLVFITNLVTGLTSATTFSVSCTTSGTGGSASFTVGLSAGTSGNTAQRVMKSGTNTLTYNLYQDPQYSQIWGASGSQLMTTNISANLSNQPYTIYGRIDSTAANLSAPTGSYTDTNLVLTLSY